MNILRRFYIGLARPDLYPELLPARLGPAIWHLLLIVALAIGAMSFGWHKKTERFMNEAAKLVRQSPDFNLSNGKFVFGGVMPFIKESKGTLFVIDTTGATGMEVLDNYDDGLLFTGTHFHIKNKLQIRSMAWSDLPISTNREKLARLLPRLAWPILILWIVGALFGAAAAKTISVVLLALAGWIAAGAKKPSFGQTAILACHALTGPIVLALLKYLFYPKTPLFGLVYWGLALFMAIFGALAAKRSLARAAVMPTPEEETAGVSGGTV